MVCVVCIVSLAWTALGKAWNTGGKESETPPSRSSRGGYATPALRTAPTVAAAAAAAAATVGTAGSVVSTTTSRPESSTAASRNKDEGSASRVPLTAVDYSSAAGGGGAEQFSRVAVPESGDSRGGTGSSDSLDGGIGLFFTRGASSDARRDVGQGMVGVCARCSYRRDGDDGGDQCDGPPPRHGYLQGSSRRESESRSTIVGEASEVETDYDGSSSMGCPSRGGISAAELELESEVELETELRRGVSDSSHHLERKDSAFPVSSNATPGIIDLINAVDAVDVVDAGGAPHTASASASAPAAAVVETTNSALTIEAGATDAASRDIAESGGKQSSEVEASREEEAASAGDDERLLGTVGALLTELERDLDAARVLLPECHRFRKVVGCVSEAVGPGMGVCPRQVKFGRATCLFWRTALWAHGKRRRILKFVLRNQLK